MIRYMIAALMCALAFFSIAATPAYETNEAKVRAAQPAPEPDCYPKEATGVAGADGINYKATAFPNGAIYTAWCKRKAGWVSFHAKTHVTSLLDPKGAGFSVQIQTLRAQSGFAGDISTYLVKELDDQLAATKPKS